MRRVGCTFVVGLMAGITVGGQFCCKTGTVALRTIDGMPAVQGKKGVIDAGSVPLSGRLTVAIQTIGCIAEGAVIRAGRCIIILLMTTVTIGPHSVEFQIIYIHMTRIAVDCGMYTHQWEARFAVESGNIGDEP